MQLISVSAKSSHSMSSEEGKLSNPGDGVLPKAEDLLPPLAVLPAPPPSVVDFYLFRKALTRNKCRLSLRYWAHW